MEIGSSVSRRTRSRSEAFLRSCINPNFHGQTNVIDYNETSETEDSLPMADEDEDDDVCESKGWRKVGRPKRKKARVITELEMECMLDEDWRSKDKDFVRQSFESRRVNNHPLTLTECRFSFEDENPCEEKTELDKEMDSLFHELNWGLVQSQHGSYSSINDDDESSLLEDVDEFPKARCDRGDHDPILDEQIGILCKYCSIILLDIKHVLPPFHVESPDKQYQTKFYHESDESKSTNHQFEFHGSTSDSGNLETCIQSTKGTVFDLIPDSSKKLYPHQLEGFEFLWRNIAGDIRLKNLQRLPSNGGRGCIISHAPGTGKTRLTIVFLQTLMELYPNCRPVIIAPRGMLLSWEQELKKWNVRINFHNLNESKLTDKEYETLAEVVGTKSCKKSTDLIRYVKLLSWMKGGSILGVAYRLFEGLAGESAGKFKKVLLESPGVIVMDEGHTPRNDQSLMWKALTKVRTRRRVILSGTPFQNNFTELYNTLCLVNPSFCSQIRSRRRPGRRGRFSGDEWGVLTDSINRNSVNDDGLQKLRLMINAFVHVHRGSILEKTLPGLRDCLVILKPTDLQTKLLQCILGVDNFLEQSNLASLISVHPSLVSKRSEFSDHKKMLKSLKSDPNAGVKTRFLMKLIRLSTSLNEKVLIFSEFIPPLNRIKKLLKVNFKWNEGREVMYMDGNIKLDERQRLIYDFNNKKGKAKVMLASQRACSEGINLVGASRVVLLDVAWNPSVERQAICRAYRLGQERMVYVYHLVTSMEVNKYERQAEKERISELIFSAGGGGGGGGAVAEDQVLEAMVRQERGRSSSMFERIVHQPKESDLVNSFGFVDFD